jgi:hypothetical protein
MEKSKNRKRFSLILAAAAGLTVGTAWAAEPPSGAPQSQPTDQELLKQFNAMKARVEKLEAKEQQQEASLQDQAKEQAQLEKRQVDATVEAVQRTAKQDSQLLDMEGFTAGYSNGKFVIQSGDGTFSWHPWIHFQFREIVNHRDDGKSAGVDDTETGFEIHRLRFGFDGNLFTPDFTYFFNWSTYPANTTSSIKVGSASTNVTNVIGGLPVLQEAWVKYKLPASDFYLKAGQMHDPLAHEEMVGSKVEIATDRSLQNDIFSNTEAFTEAATVIYDPHDSFRAEGGVNHGLRGADTNFQDYPNNGNAYDWGVAARTEFKVMGNWKDYDQITAYGNKSDLLVFGAGIDYSEAGKDAQLTHAFDVQYGAASGLFLYGSYMGRYTRHNIGIPLGAPVGTAYGTPGASGLNTYEPSVVFQVNYTIDAHWEPFARYEYIHLAGTPAGSDNNVQEITGGVGYWFHGHNAKLTTQVMYLPYGIPINDAISDVLISNHHSEVIFITQFQLLL